LEQHGLGPKQIADTCRAAAREGHSDDARRMSSVS
jgi:hypothetical protein